MDQFEKNIAHARRRIQMVYSALPGCVAANAGGRIVSNYWKVAEYNIYIGLTEWRRGNSPVDAFHAGIDAAEQLIDAIAERQAPDEDPGYGADFRLVGFIGYLVSRRIDFGRNQSLLREFPYVMLQQRLLQALYDEPYRDDLEPLMAKLAQNKQAALALDSEQTYFSLLDAADDAAKVATLVAHAESNYKKRARDRNYSAGVGYRGGGPDNPYCVDWELASVLKKINWSGESIHRYRW